MTITGQPVHAHRPKQGPCTPEEFNCYLCEVKTMAKKTIISDFGGLKGKVTFTGPADVPVNSKKVKHHKKVSPGSHHSYNQMIIT